MYAENCWAMDWARFCSLFDCFAAAHLLGWFFKALLIRHHGILWTISISWEITEVGPVLSIRFSSICSCSWTTQSFCSTQCSFSAHLIVFSTLHHVLQNELISLNSTTGNDDYHSTINTPHPFITPYHALNTPLCSLPHIVQHTSLCLVHCVIYL